MLTQTDPSYFNINGIGELVNGGGRDTDEIAMADYDVMKSSHPGLSCRMIYLVVNPINWCVNSPMRTLWRKHGTS